MTLGLFAPSLSALRRRSDVGADELQQLVLQRGTHFGRVGLACDAGVVAQFLDELFAGFRAHVGKQKGVFDVLPVGFGELILGEDVEQGFAERVAGLGQARLEALHAGAGGFGGFHHGLRDAEVPRPRTLTADTDRLRVP